jgi:hypothetical protein
LFADVTARGCLLAEYDRAAWQASDALQLLKADPSALDKFIARRTAAGTWDVVFGRRNSSEDEFPISYEAHRNPPAARYVAAAVLPVRRDRAYLLFASRAIDTSLKAFGGGQRGYNAAVLPSDGDQW